MFPNPQKYVDLANIRIFNYLLPDTCNIQPVVRTADGSGGYGETPGDLRTYRNSTAIPCRLDPAKQYKDADIYTEEVTITTYTLNIPYDCDCEIDDIVTHNAFPYTIKQLTDDNSFRSVKKLFLVAVK